MKEFAHKKCEQQRAMCADGVWNNSFDFMSKLSPQEGKELMMRIENYDEPKID